MTEPTPTNETAITPPEAPQPPRHEWRWVGVCLAASLFSLLAAGGAGRHQSPPSIQTVWLISEAAGLGAIVLALWRSSMRPRRWGVRIALPLSLLLALPAIGLPFLSYLHDFADLPWITLGLVLCGLIVGGWRCGQRWLAVCACAGVVWFAMAAWAPPTNPRLPRTIRRGDLAVTVTSLRRDRSVVFCNLELKGAPRMALDRAYDLGHVRLEGRMVRGAFSFSCWHATRSEFAGAPVNQAVLSAYTFPPRWVRRLDITVTVPCVAPPDASVTIPLPLPRGPASCRFAANSTRGGRLIVSDVRPLAPRGGAHSLPGIGLTIGRDTRASAQKDSTVEYWALDQDGRDLPLRPGAAPPTAEGMPVELWPAADVRQVTIGASDSATERRTLVFRFTGLRNPRSGEIEGPDIIVPDKP